MGRRWEHVLPLGDGVPPSFSNGGADPRAQAAVKARVGELEAENAALKEASRAAHQEAATALALLPARRRTTVEAAARSSAALARLTASRRASRVPPPSPAHSPQAAPAPVQGSSGGAPCSCQPTVVLPTHGLAHKHAPSHVGGCAE